MKGGLRIGVVGEERFVVSEQHLIDFAHDGMLRILCAPRLAWFLEHAARNAVLALLEPGESTVGVVINVKQPAATPLGEQLVCCVQVIYTDGPQISFQFEGHGEHERVTHGTHKLRAKKLGRPVLRTIHRRQNAGKSWEAKVLTQDG